RRPREDIQRLRAAPAHGGPLRGDPRAPPRRDGRGDAREAPARGGGGRAGGVIAVALSDAGAGPPGVRGGRGGEGVLSFGTLAAAPAYQQIDRVLRLLRDGPELTKLCGVRGSDLR